MKANDFIKIAHDINNSKNVILFLNNGYSNYQKLNVRHILLMYTFS